VEGAAPAGYKALRMPEEWFELDADEAHVARERERARALRKTAWWQRRVQRGACAYCGRKVPPRELTMDHVVPIARGGRSTKGNVVAACKECNNRKKLMTPAEQLLLKPLHPPSED
jgi:5-methylcytosine-specific restriction protein A